MLIRPRKIGLGLQLVSGMSWKLMLVIPWFPTCTAAMFTPCRLPFARASSALLTSALILLRARLLTIMLHREVFLVSSLWLWLLFTREMSISMLYPGCSLVVHPNVTRRGLGKASFVKSDVPFVGRFGFLQPAIMLMNLTWNLFLLSIAQGGSGGKE